MTHNVCGLAMLPITAVEYRTNVQDMIKGTIELRHGNIAKPLVSCCYGH